MNLPDSTPPVDVGFRDPQKGWERSRGSTVHRLSDRTWWMDVRGYQSTVVVGDESVLVIDPLSEGRASQLQGIVHDRIGLPVSAVFYSHHHKDHVADAHVFAESSRGRSLDVIAARPCAELVSSRKTALAPTIVLDDSGALDFEGIRLQAQVVGGHTVDSTAIVLPDEGVVHTSDLVHPLQMEFPFFGMAVDVESYVDALVAVLEMDWDFLTAGHGNIGTRTDLRDVLAYVDDFRRAIRAALDTRDVGSYAADGARGYVAINSWRADVVEDAVDALRPTWGQTPGFEDAVRTHGDRIFFDEVWFLTSGTHDD